MDSLMNDKCVPCQRGGDVATEQEIARFKSQVPEWEIADKTGVQVLKRVFLFKNFKQALDFVNRVGELAEAEYHHPTLVLGWGRVEVSWTTHKINGLHKNDFVMAAKTDALV